MLSLALRRMHPSPPASTEDPIFRTVRLEDRVDVAFALDAHLRDPIAQMLAEHARSDDPVRALAFHLLKRGDTVLDLGAHIGTFALGMAAIGCRVLAVEAAAGNAELLRAASARNGFAELTVLHAAVAAARGTVWFTPDGPCGQAGRDRPGGEPAIEVPAVAVDDVLADRSWHHVDLVKIDVEGSEPQALAGMSNLLRRDDAPPILIECNGHTLAHYGSTTHELRAELERFGYRVPLHRLEFAQPPGAGVCRPSAARVRRGLPGVQDDTADAGSLVRGTTIWPRRTGRTRTDDVPRPGRRSPGLRGQRAERRTGLDAGPSGDRRSARHAVRRSGASSQGGGCSSRSAGLAFVRLPSRRPGCNS